MSDGVYREACRCAAPKVSVPVLRAGEVGRCVGVSVEFVLGLVGDVEVWVVVVGVLQDLRVCVD